MQEQSIGPYWEDFKEGEVFVSPWGRTIGDADVKKYAGVAGNFQPLHMDDEYAKASDFGKRIAHEFLTAIVALGIPIYFQVLGNGIGFLEWRNKMVAPVFIGDTLRCEMTIVGKRETKKADRGIVFYHNSAKNQRGEEVLQAEYTVMIRRRPK